jgi:hypothetical protein
MRTATLFAAFGFALALASSIPACVGDEPGPAATGDDGGTPDGTTTPPDGSGLTANGLACKADADCSSGHCTDGVCCETACNGVCESCALPDGPGKCLPIPNGTDPDHECLPAPLPDAGAPPPADAGDGGATDGSEAGATDAASDTGPAYNFPDGGITYDDSKCAGSCNGKRACSFPDATKQCGTQFCNTSSQAAGLDCDGKGHCGISTTNCSDYTCTGTSCGTSCTSHAQCLSTDFCNISGATGTCVPKRGLGVTCGNSTECASGFCVQQVCCNSECNSIVGATCTQSGSVGNCKCSVDCGTGSCVLWYKDGDLDTYGDPNTANAKVGCDNQSPPSGYVTNNTDCDDTNNNVHPNQTGWFTTPRANNTYDYNCDGTDTEQYTTSYPGASCHFCPAPPAPGTTCPAFQPTCGTSTYCSGSGEAAYLQCQYACGSSGIFCLNPPCPESANCVGSAGVRFCLVGTDCTNETLRQGWTDPGGAPGCGKYGSYFKCGYGDSSCTTTGNITGTSVISQQACH